MYDIIVDLRKRFDEAGLNKDGAVKATLGYGHVGDSNLHLNVIAEKWDKRIEETIEPWVYEWVGECE
jgi:hypothetical protein